LVGLINWLPASPVFSRQIRYNVIKASRDTVGSPDYFVIDPKTHTRHPDLVPSRQFYRDQWVLVHLPGLTKNAAPRHPSLTLWAGSHQQIKSPGYLCQAGTRCKVHKLHKINQTNKYGNSIKIRKKRISRRS
jgi:hypothetical protein